MNYKAVVTDLDGTLLDENHQLTEIGRLGLKKIHDNGVIVILATGRHHINVKKLKKEIGIKSYAITSNGNIVLDEDDEIIFSHKIDGSIVKDILVNTEYENSTHINMFQDDKWLIEKVENYILDVDVDELGIGYDVIDFKKLDNYDAQKIYYMEDDNDKLVKLEKSISNRFSDKVDTIFSLPTCLEIMNKGVSKRSALIEVLERLSINKNEIVAFGDGFNDYELLEYAGKAFIMDNAHESLKNALPELEIIKKNSEDGVINKLKELFPEILNDLNI